MQTIIGLTELFAYWAFLYWLAGSPRIMGRLWDAQKWIENYIERNRP